MLVLNTPHNPLGKVFSRSELENIASFCIKHDLICLSDEVYEWIVFGENGDEHIKIASLPGMWGRTITVGSAGKTFSVTGWKLGWSIGPAELVQAMQSHQQNTIYTCATPTQEAVARSLEHELNLLQSLKGEQLENHCYLRSLRHELKKFSYRMADCLQKANMTPVKPQSGYFMIADASNLPLPQEFERQLPYWDLRANDWLMREKGICGIPQSVFYNSAQTKKEGEKYIRWCFAKQEPTLEKAFAILHNL
ncbi:Kynurenine--oxoglutarate transaminase 3 [Cichlidogyrus casuarinus]|uniref:kynurenine--oxoglutarate transaminase n=1 Tax=Cichlidogyrus casuarinus TaxID=1844966 RepID=A0ABD2PVF2_9PLAT